MRPEAANCGADVSLPNHGERNIATFWGKRVSISNTKYDDR